MKGSIQELGGIAGLVLAGGRSRRMGRDKSALRVGNETLLVRQVRLLRECGASECWVSVGRSGQIDLDPQGGGVIPVIDAIEEGGPMEGIRQVLERSQAAHLLVLAVDLPGLSLDFLGRLLERRRVGVGVIPVGESGMEPLCAVYPVRPALEAVKVWAGVGEASPRRIAAEGLAGGWMESWTVEGPDRGCLVNWNRPEDWDSGFGARGRSV